ncbi:MAG TPA: hypothetical protein VL992_08225 [Tepidisphaeraceae bacterium]|nr:hypothetical protein [Tepidisphaeraceae bacterium]
MFAVFNVIFLLLLVGIPTAIAAIAFAAIARFRRVRRWYLWALAGPVLALVFLVGYYFWVTDPNWIFKQEFGFPASPPVVVHDAVSWGLWPLLISGS